MSKPYACLPSITVSNSASPLDWSQNWAHEFSGAANHSEISIFRDLLSLPWAQGAAGSNPVAPTIFSNVSSQDTGDAPALAFATSRSYGV